MCNPSKGGCMIQDNLKTKPEECTPEQIKKCHGEVLKHPCIQDKKED